MMDENSVNNALETTEQLEPTTEVSETQPDIAEDGLAISEDGEVVYGDKFFGDFTDEQPDNLESQGGQDTQPNNVTDITPLQGQQTEPAYYTQDDLKNTPVYQWQKDRIPADMKVTDVFDMVSPFVQTIVQQNMMFRQALSNIQNQSNVSVLRETSNEAVPLMTDDEMDDAAVKLACERLKIDAKDFDPYEMKHQLALNRASAEIRGHQAGIRQQQEAEAQFQRDRVALGQYIGQFQQQPDYAAFNQWLGEQLVREGRSQNAILDDLNQNRDVRRTMAIISQYYQQFRQIPKPAPKATQSQPQLQAKKVPVVESTGNSKEGKPRSYDFKNYSKLSQDEQVQMLIDMGLCELL